AALSTRLRTWHRGRAGCRGRHKDVSSTPPLARVAQQLRQQGPKSRGRHRSGFVRSAGWSESVVSRGPICPGQVRREPFAPVLLVSKSWDLVAPCLSAEGARERVTRRGV